MLIALIFVITVLLPEGLTQNGPPPDLNSTNCADNRMKKEWRELIVKMHNFRRSQLAKKTMMRKPKNDLPQAANMEKMAYSCPLETDAFMRASNCTISTFPGTNLAVVNIADQSPLTIQEDIREAVKSWWSVVEMNGPTSDVIFKQEYENMTTASFTQRKYCRTTNL
ncbi:hypothetical protein V3C99_004074 [Haemonchus contortus]